MPRDGQPREPYERPLLGLSQRVPPGSIEAEQALLGALLANNKAYERVCDFLRAEHFLDPINGRIYRQIEERLVMGRLADAVTLRQDFENTGLLDEVGGAPYLARLL
ncbi:MAG TPA: DnaB-like helicase N-terminal domain-containing protein, partial [Ktedonobacterales bacterium]|nr:DnaB-like helicase N-terminal domain-containing protein [Ktedonobacterales bacterium]